MYLKVNEAKINELKIDVCVCVCVCVKKKKIKIKLNCKINFLNLLKYIN